MNTTTTHKSAGTYYPAAPGARSIGESESLYVQGLRVSAQVGPAGEWAVFAGTEIIAEGTLAGDEGDLMVFFAAEALVWSAGIDLDRVGEADTAEQATALEGAVVTGKDAALLVAGLDGEYSTREKYSHDDKVIGTYRMLDLIDNALRGGMNVEVKSNATNDGWYIEFNDGGNSGYGQFHFIGRK
jgi:hypothetical protein